MGYLLPGGLILPNKRRHDELFRNNIGIKLKIGILTLFYRTFGFCILVTLMVLLIIVVFNLRYYRINQQRRRLEKMVDDRTQELKENNQILLNKTEELNHYNLLLTERQKHIEEQSDELASQKEELLAGKEQLEMAIEALNESNAAKDKLFSIIAHDLRTPFNSLLGMSELLYRNVENWENDKVQKIVELIHESAKQAYGLL